MIAKTLIKRESEFNTFDGIIKRIKEDNENGFKALFIAHWFYVSEDTKIKLIQEGFSIRIVDWDGMVTNGLIIEW